jgi:ribosomal protein S18 acetylase RimI-like enzyme
MKSSSNESSASRLTLRPPRADDRAPVGAILEATGAFSAEEVAVALELVDAAVARPDHDYIVRVLETPLGRVTGYTCYGRTPFTEGTYDLYWIAVHPDCHGDGSARRLMAEAEEDIRARGGRIILVETASKPSYARTRRFYESIGYVEVARIPDFYARGDDRVTYWKRLSIPAPPAAPEAGR